MEGVSEFPLRLWMHLTSAPAFAGTPFLRVTPTFPARGIPERFAPELTVLRGALPYQLRPQLMAAASADFVRVAAALLPHSDTVELNCGCPAPCSVGSGAGSSLLQEPARFGRFVTEIAAALEPGRLAVKMRTGFADSSRFADLVEELAELPLARLTVHGRTRAARYTGRADWQLIAAAQTTRPALPVVGSGDIVDRSSLRRALATAATIKTVAVGRGALRNPWIFAELRAAADAGDPTALTGETLILALGAHTLLHELELTSAPRLYREVEAGYLQAPCGTDAERWRDVFGRLAFAAFGRAAEPTALEVSRIALGRLKMQWSSLRSALPPAFFEPTLLRAKSVGELLAAIDAVGRRRPDAATLLTLRHEPGHDWLYAGEKKPAADGAAVASSS
jgi:tRNA-dihydrouridine synthase